MAFTELEGPFHKTGCLCTECLLNVDACVQKIASCPRSPVGSYLWDSSLPVTLRGCMPYDSFHQSMIIQRYVDTYFRNHLEKLLLFSLVYQDYLVLTSVGQHQKKTENNKVHEKDHRDDFEEKEAEVDDHTDVKMRGDDGNKTQQQGGNHHRVDGKAAESNLPNVVPEKGDIGNEVKLSSFGKRIRTQEGGGDLSLAGGNDKGETGYNHETNDEEIGKASLMQDKRLQPHRKRSYIKMRKMGGDRITSLRFELLERFSMMCTYEPAATVLAKYTPEIWPWLHGFILDLADETEMLSSKEDHHGCPSCRQGAFGLKLYNDGGMAYLLHDVIVLTEGDDLVRALRQEAAGVPSFFACVATILQKHTSFRVLWMALRIGIYFMDIGGIMGYKILKDAGVLPAVLSFIERARGWQPCAFVRALIKWALVLRMFLDGTLEIHYFRNKSQRVRLQMDEGDDFYPLRKEMYEVEYSLEGVMPEFCSNPVCTSYIDDRTKRMDSFRTCRYCKLVQYCSTDCQADHWHAPGPDGHMERCFSRDMLVSNCKNLD